MMNVEIAMRTIRRWRCRRWYGYETGNDEACPMCAKDEVQALNRRNRELARSNAALRGILKRRSRRNK